MNRLTIATRGSALALWQAHHVKARLEAAAPGIAVELLIIKTQGDKIQDVPLSQVGGKGLFVKEIEEALLDGRADLAVHSMKDVPAEVAAGLQIAAVSAREDPRDAMLGHKLADLPRGAVVGTSSTRRACLLRSLRPDLEIRQLRGNVDTRLRKLAEGLYDAIVLAAAGLRRLGHADRIAETLDPRHFIPAIGQGALALETRLEGDVVDLIRRAVHDEATAVCVAAERAFLARLGVGCTAPIACHATLDGDGTLEVNGMIGDVEAGRVIGGSVNGAGERAVALGGMLADQLLRDGGTEVLARHR